MTIGNETLSEAIANIDVEKLGFSNRTLNCLKQNNIMTLSDLLSLQREQIAGFRSAGVKTVTEVMNYIEEKEYMDIKLEEKMKSTVLHYVIDDSINNEINKVYFLVNNELVEDVDVAMSGFSKNLSDLFLKSNITKCNQIINMQYSAFIKLRSMGAKKIETALEFLREITFPLYVDESKNTLLRERLTENEVVKIIGNTPVSYYEIRGRVENFLADELVLDQILEKLKRNKVIEETQSGYVRYLPWAVDCLPMLISKEPQILSHRMQGMTLEQIGKVMDLTRERVRQIEDKALKRMPMVRESRFVYWYNNYEMKQSDFTYVFDISDDSYNYIKLFLSEKNEEKKSIIDLFDDELLPNSNLIRLESIARQYCIRIGGKYVPISKEHILRRIMELRFFDKSCTLKTLFDEYSDLITDRDLVRNNPKLIFGDLHTLDAFIKRKSYVIAGQNTEIRFYDYSKYDFDSLFKQINFSRYSNKLISAKVIFDKYKELMDEYDIKNENELHNIIRKYQSMIPNDLGLSLKKMPTIEIGEINVEKQVLQLLYKIAPVNKSDFAEIYSEEYGIEPATFLGNYNQYFDKYDNHGVLDVAQEPMNDDEISYMRDELKEDLYFLEDLEEIYSNIFPNGNVNRVNPLNLKKIGFQVYSQYIIRDSYSSSDDYFTTLIKRDDVFDLNLIDSRIKYIQMFFQKLEKLRVAYEIVEIDKGKYITFENLNRKYPFITKKDLQEYANELPKFVKSNIFTTRYANNIGFNSSIDELNESDWFYSALLRANKEIGYQRVGNGFIFSHDRDNISMATFVEHIINNRKQVTIDEILDEAKSQYGIILERYKVINIIDNSNVYYDRETGIIYVEE